MSDRLSDEQVVESHLWADLEVMASHVGARLHALATEVQASRKLIADLRALHVQSTAHSRCYACDALEYPCSTIRLIEEAGL